MIVVETERLILRHLREDDQNDLFRILSDPITMSFWPSPYTEEGTREWIARNRERYVTEGFGRYAVILRASGELIGDCGTMRFEIDGTLENDLGYIIFHKHWGQAYATEAAEACKGYALGSLGLDRLCANMPVDHTASRRVAEKIGMHLEKQFQNKRNRDIWTCLYSLGRERRVDTPA